ncbi:MAG: DUF4252 domain-containing protein [Muribaculaceae bacterium]|nr:DUF4252 domain-containing protein [Muribaculaceae bacterium]
MKRIFLIAIITLATLAAKAQTFLESCEDVKGITTVYVSKAMIAMAGNLGSGDNDGVNFNSLAGKLDNIQIANADGSAASILKTRAKVFSTSKGYEELVRVREDKENVKILMKKLKPALNEFVIVAEEANEMSVIILTGSMTMEDVMAAVK